MISGTRLLQGLLGAEVVVGLGVGWLLRTLHDWPLAAAVGAGLAVPLLLHGLVLGAQFALAIVAGRRDAPREPLQLGIWLRAWLRNWRDSVRAFTFAQPLLCARALPQPAAARRVPVLFVHGYGCNGAVWHPFARHLAARGHPVHALSLEPLLGSIDGYADAIAEAARQLRARSGRRGIALVCHSMGGLAARAYLRRHPDDEVLRIVTIGSPHRGTRHASLGLGQNALQMRRDAPWLRALAESETASLRRRFTVILSRHDNVLSPATDQTLPDAETVIVEGVGHLSLVYEPQIWEHVADRLAQPDCDEAPTAYGAQPDPARTGAV